MAFRFDRRLFGLLGGAVFVNDPLGGLRLVLFVFSSLTSGRTSTGAIGVVSTRTSYFLGGSPNGTHREVCLTTCRSTGTKHNGWFVF